LCQHAEDSQIIDNIYYILRDIKQYCRLKSTAEIAEEKIREKNKRSMNVATLEAVDGDAECS